MSLSQVKHTLSVSLAATNVACKRCDDWRMFLGSLGGCFVGGNFLMLKAVL